MVYSFFEGPEKKLELVVTPPTPALRGLGRDRWEAIVQAARATVLSTISSDSFDAYLLSESSLFVFDDHVTMITCGRTQLVDAALALVDEVGRDNVALLVYERKNEHFPERQPSTFIEDARRLDAVIPGTAHRFGTEHDHRIEMFVSATDYRPDTGDVTLEVLMHGLDAGAAEAFAHGPASARTAGVLGLDRLLDGFEVDEHAFDPAGYSLNAVRDAHYYTIHVTPEAEGSYASFETNWDFSADPAPLVGKVIDAFTPESFDVLSFVPGGRPLSVEVPGYTRRKHVAAVLAGYQITFVSMFAPRDLEAPFDLSLAVTS
jgi:S-adenosylmethionine decarboxylase